MSVEVGRLLDVARKISEPGNLRWMEPEAIYDSVNKAIYIHLFPGSMVRHALVTDITRQW